MNIPGSLQAADGGQHDQLVGDLEVEERREEG